MQLAEFLRQMWPALVATILPCKRVAEAAAWCALYGLVPKRSPLRRLVMQAARKWLGVPPE